MPVAIDLGAILALVLAFIVCYGFLFAYRGTLKPLLLGAAALFNFRVGAGPVSLGRPMAAIARWITWVAEEIDYGLAQAVLATEKGTIKLWHGLAAQARFLGNLLGDLAETIEGKWRWFLLAFPPAALAWAAVHAAQQLPALWKAVHATGAHVVNVTTKVVKQTTQVTHVTKVYVSKTVHQAIAATAGAVTAPLPWTMERINWVGRTARQARAEARRLAKLLEAGAFAGAVAVALGRLGASWIRCPSLQKIGKKHGCAPWRFLEHLIEPALDVLVFVDICVVASLIRRAATAARPVLTELLVGIDAALCKGHNQPPPELELHAAALPPVRAPLAL